MCARDCSDWLAEGFKHPPMDHYMLPIFSKYAADELSPDCFDGEPLPMLTVNFGTEMVKSYNNHSVFFYGHLATQHHNRRCA